MKRTGIERKKCQACTTACTVEGQVSIEALFVLLAFFAVLSQLALFEFSQWNRAGDFMARANTRATTEKMAITIDAMSANPGAMAFSVSQKCQGNGTSAVYCKGNAIEFGSPTIALKIETIQKGKSFILRLGNEAHYE